MSNAALTFTDVARDDVGRIGTAPVSQMTQGAPGQTSLRLDWRAARSRCWRISWVRCLLALLEKGLLKWFAVPIT
jgi:hypothetical protein